MQTGGLWKELQTAHSGGPYYHPHSQDGVSRHPAASRSRLVLVSPLYSPSIRHPAVYPLLSKPLVVVHTRSEVSGFVSSRSVKDAKIRLNYRGSCDNLSANLFSSPSYSSKQLSNIS